VYLASGNVGMAAASFGAATFKAARAAWAYRTGQRLASVMWNRNRLGRGIKVVAWASGLAVKNAYDDIRQDFKERATVKARVAVKADRPMALSTYRGLSAQKRAQRNAGQKAKLKKFFKTGR
jgi:hypothetical protein